MNTAKFVDFYQQDLAKSTSRLSLMTLRDAANEQKEGRSGWHSTAGKRDAFVAFANESEVYGFCCYSDGSASVHKLWPDQIKVARWLCETAGDGEVHLRGNGTEFTGRVKTAHADWNSSYVWIKGNQLQVLRLHVDCMLESEHITLPVHWALFGDEVLRVDHYEAGSNMGFTNRPEGAYLSMRLEFDLPDELVNRTALTLDSVLTAQV